MDSESTLHRIFIHSASEQLNLPAFECFTVFASSLRANRALYFNQEFGSPIGAGSR
jgi:hypothetical protein